MDDCVFCKIINGELPSSKVYEDEKTLAFMDISRDVDGHILVIPKKHVKNILDCDEETLFAVMATVKKISNHLTDNCGYDGVNIFNINEQIQHFHMHIIPRKVDDKINVWPHFEGAKRTQEEVFNEIKMI